jgi:hypothetical protein
MASELQFCYYVNMLLKVHQQNSTIGVPVVGIAGDDKECYRFEVSQTLSCNCDLVNQIPMGSTATFKCDILVLKFIVLHSSAITRGFIK